MTLLTPIGYYNYFVFSYGISPAQVQVENIFAIESIKVAWIDMVLVMGECFRQNTEKVHGILFLFSVEEAMFGLRNLLLITVTIPKISPKKVSFD